MPCDSEVVHKTIDVCQLVREGLGAIGSAAIKNAEAMCACGPEAFELVKDGLFEAVESGADLSAGVLRLVGALVNAQKVSRPFVDVGRYLTDGHAVFCGPWPQYPGIEGGTQHHRRPVYCGGLDCDHSR